MKKRLLLLLPLLLLLGGCGDIDWFPNTTPTTPITPTTPPTAVTADPTGTVTLVDINLYEGAVTPTSVAVDIVLNLKNNSTTKSYTVKADYVIPDANGNVVYSGSVQGPVGGPVAPLQDFQLYTVGLTIDPATYAKFGDVPMVVAITITPVP